MASMQELHPSPLLSLGWSEVTYPDGTVQHYEYKKGAARDVRALLAKRVPIA